MKLSIDIIKKILALLGIDPSEIKCPKCGASIDTMGAVLPTNPEIPVKPDVPTGTKPYPGKVIFDKTSDQGTGAYYGTACVLLDPGMVKVELNGEVALKGDQHNGKDVWRFIRVGDAYSQPWQFRFTSVDGTIYTYTEAKAPVVPTGSRSETVKPSSYGNGDRGNARFSHPGGDYGKNIQVWIDGKLMMTVADGSKRQEGAGGLIWKPISDSNKMLVVVGPHGLHFNSCTIKY